jgi:hypothetical protein
VEKTWKPTVAGILNIIAGVLSLLGFIGVIVAIVIVSSSPFIFDYIPEMVPITGLLETIMALVAVYLLITGVLPLLGGIYALQRKKWGWALAGSIVAIIGSTVFGIASTILIALSNDEFD